MGHEQRPKGEPGHGQHEAQHDVPQMYMAHLADASPAQRAYFMRKFARRWQERKERLAAEPQTKVGAPSAPGTAQAPPATAPPAVAPSDASMDGNPHDIPRKDGEIRTADDLGTVHAEPALADAANHFQPKEAANIGADTQRASGARSRITAARRARFNDSPA